MKWRRATSFALAMSCAGPAAWAQDATAESTTLAPPAQAAKSAPVIETPSSDGASESGSQPSSLPKTTAHTELADASPELPSTRLASEQLRVVDEILRNAALDLQLPLAWLAPTTSAEVNEEELLRKRRSGWSIAAQLTTIEQGLLLRLHVVPPGRSSIGLARVRVTNDDLEVRTIQALRHLASVYAAPKKSAGPIAKPAAPQPTVVHSAGRAILAAHGAAVGGYLGFSLEHIGGSGDSRLTFPLMTLGAGAGLGASLIIAEEWDISEAEAKYLWAAGTWPTLAALLIADDLNEGDATEYGYGLLGVTSGLTLGAIAVNWGDIQEGGDVLTHSGTALGALLGGLGELAIEGDTTLTPKLGLGFGAIAGLLSFGAAAPHLPELSTSTILFANLSAGLGGLTGAALASPFVVGDDVSKRDTRIWLSTIGVGTLAGGALGFWLSTNTSASLDATKAPSAAASNGLQLRPLFGSLRPGPLEPSYTFAGIAGKW